MTPRALGSLVRLGALHHFAWRLDVVLALASSALVLGVSGHLWGTVVAGEGAVAGRSPTWITTYVVVAWVASRLTTTRVDEDLGQRFVSGQIASDLHKPVDLRVYLLARDLGRLAATGVLTALPLAALGSWWFPMAWPSGALAWLATAASVLLGAVVGAQVALLVGLMAIRSGHVAGWVSLKEVGVALLSGALVPLPLMPDGAVAVVSWLPFRAMADTPARVFLGELTGLDLAGALAWQGAWAVLLAAVASRAWRRTLHRLTVVGG